MDSFVWLWGRGGAENSSTATGATLHSAAGVLGSFFCLKSCFFRQIWQRFFAFKMANFEAICCIAFFRFFFEKVSQIYSI